jgi:hypothetical protein
MYAEWGVDFIKCDDICDSRLYRGENIFSGWEETRMIHRAIEKTGREIVLSLSPGPAHIDRAWEYCRYANMWRITDDFWDDWKLLKEMFWRCESWQDHVREGCFPDCDMLPVGKIGGGFGSERNTNFTTDELHTMMTLWCIFRSPLMIGADLTQLDKDTLALLTNADILAMLKKECSGKQVYRGGDAAVWSSRNSATGDIYVALFNLTDEKAEISVSDAEVARALGLPALPEKNNLFELWEKTTETHTAGMIRTQVAAHGVRVYRLA